MKLLLTLMLQFACACAFSKTYYISLDGSNQNDGLTPATALKSLGRVNPLLTRMQPGDSLLFRRGDRFHGAITISVSGNAKGPIYIGAYGNGAEPVINGFLSLTRWVQIRQGVYETTLPASLTPPGMVTFNGRPQAIGRFPNATAPNRGYLSYETHNGLNSITDRDFTHPQDWTGADIIIRKNRWVIDKCKITRQAGNSFTYVSPSGQIPTDNFGYFIQNDPRTLDELGEWFYDSASHKFQMFFGNNDPAKFAVQASVIRSLLICRGQSFITIENMVFEGANGTTLDIADNANNVTLRNCKINFSGEYALRANSLKFLTVENCKIENSLNTALYVAPFASGAIIRNNIISKTGLIPGMGASDNQALEGIVIHGQAPMVRNLVELNRIDSTGYIPITFLGDSITVQKNYITNFCLTTDDGGGIYSSGNYESRGRSVQKNIVLDGKGSHEGTNQLQDVAAHGIYMDDRTANVEILDNTVSRCSENGIYLHNANGITIAGNTIFNCGKAQINMNQDSEYPIRKVNIKGNILASAKETQFISAFYSTKDDLQQFATSDGNFLFHPNNLKPLARMSSPSRKSDLNLSDFRQNAGQEKNSTSTSGTITPLFYFNATNKATTIKLPGTFTDLRKKKYAGSITLEPYSSAVLIKSK